MKVDSMADNIPQAPQGEFVLFTSADGQTRVECRFESDTLWLSQAAMAELYQVSSQAITQHVKLSILKKSLSKFQLVGITYKFNWKVAEK